MQLRVCATEAGFPDPARTTVNVCLGRFAQGDTPEHSESAEAPGEEAGSRSPNIFPS